MKRPIDKIAAIAAAVYQADRARLIELDREEDRLREQLAEIDTALASLRSRQTIDPDAARINGADELWRQWIEVRRTAIMSERFKVRAKRADLMLELRKSFGRSAAADAAARSEEADERRRLSRQEDWRA